MEFVNVVIKSLYENTIEETVEIFLNQKNTEIFSTFINHNPTDNSKKYVNDDGVIHEQKFEAYQTLTKDSTLDKKFIRHPYNLNYKITFPHELIGNNIPKFTRRLSRLKTLLLNEDIFLSFIYISPSSEDTHYSIDGHILTNGASEEINKLCEFLENKRNNFEMIFIDSLKENVILNNKVKKIEVDPYNNWFPMITKNNINIT
jgi:hypothetical protein